MAQHTVERYPSSRADVHAKRGQTASDLVRWGGLTVFLGAVLWAVQKISWTLFIGDQDPLTYPQPTATILWVLGLVAALLVLLGLPALYARQAKQAGRLGLIAFVVVFLGMALAVANGYFGTFIQRGLVDLISLAEEAGVTVQEPAEAIIGFIISVLFYLLGWLLFGLASLRARVLPRWAAVVVLIGLLSAFLLFATNFSLFTLPVTEVGIAGLGLALWQEQGNVLAQATRTSEAG